MRAVINPQKDKKRYIERKLWLKDTGSPTSKGGNREINTLTSEVSSHLLLEPLTGLPQQEFKVREPSEEYRLAFSRVDVEGPTDDAKHVLLILVSIPFCIDNLNVNQDCSCW